MDAQARIANPSKGLSRRGLLVGAGALAAAGGAGYWLLTGPGSGPGSFGALGGYVIVPSSAVPQLTLVSLDGGEIAGTIDLPQVPDLLLISRTTDRVLFANRDTGLLSALDIQTRQITDTLSLPFAPRSMVLSNDGLKVALADPDSGTLGIVDLSRFSILPPATGLNRPHNLSFDLESDYVFVPDSTANRIRTFNTASGIELDPIKLSAPLDPTPIGDGEGLSAITRSLSGLFGMTTDSRTGLMTILSFREWAEYKTVQLGKGPTRPYGTADGRYMLVANEQDRTVSVVSTDFYDVVATLPGLSDVTSIATGYLERVAAIVSAKERKVAFIDLVDMKAAGSVDLEGQPGSAIVDSDGLKMYVALNDADALAIIDMRYGEVSRVLKGVADSPANVAMASTNNYCH